MTVVSIIPAVAARLSEIGLALVFLAPRRRQSLLAVTVFASALALVAAPRCTRLTRW